MFSERTTTTTARMIDKCTSKCATRIDPECNDAIRAQQSAVGSEERSARARSARARAAAQRSGIDPLPPPCACATHARGARKINAYHVQQHRSILYRAGACLTSATVQQKMNSPRRQRGMARRARMARASSAPWKKNAGMQAQKRWSENACKRHHQEAAGRLPLIGNVVNVTSIASAMRAQQRHSTRPAVAEGGHGRQNTPVRSKDAGASQPPDGRGQHKLMRPATLLEMQVAAEKKIHLYPDEGVQRTTMPRNRTWSSSCGKPPLAMGFGIEQITI